MGPRATLEEWTIGTLAYRSTGQPAAKLFALPRPSETLGCDASPRRSKVARHPTCAGTAFIPCGACLSQLLVPVGRSPRADPITSTETRCRGPCHS